MGPLSDALELGQVVAGPCCGQVFADLGADVVKARGKPSITVDLRTDAGQQPVHRLAADNPGPVLVRISGFGQDGPYAARPAYASVGEAMSGLRAPTGSPDRPHVRACSPGSPTPTSRRSAPRAIV